MGIRWLVNGVFYKEPWYPVPQNAQVIVDDDDDVPRATERAASVEKPPPDRSLAHDPYKLPLPPPNSEVAAQPRADLEHRIQSVSFKDDPVQAIEKSVHLHNQSRDLNDYPTTISDLITRGVVTVGPEATVDEAMEKLQESDFHHLPVVDSEGKLIGLVSDRDLLGKDGQLSETMVPKVLTASEDTQIQEATKALVDRQFHSLVVVDQETRPQGMITSFDLLRYLVEHPAMRLWQSGRH